MFILGIESSCDETAASLVKDGKFILSNIISSQVEIHKPYGGVVPEIASRHHLVALLPVINDALKPLGGIEHINKVDAIAVTNGPGLIGSLLVGLQGAKTIAWLNDIKLIGVNHLEGHLKAPFCGFEDAPPPKEVFPHISLLVSGGHSILFYVEKDKRTILGATRDDAAGEAFDKVAKMLGLGYPGGRIIDEMSEKGKIRFKLPRGLHKKGGYDFSFSGLKTSVRQLIERLGADAEDAIPDICASFREAAVDSLLEKTRLALQNHKNTKALVIAGGVAANALLRQKSAELAAEIGVEFIAPPKVLCTDNAAMIAASGYDSFIKKDFADNTLNAFSSSLWSKRGILTSAKGR